MDAQGGNTKPTNKAPTYWDYLRIPQLLSLQDGVDESDDNISSDELNFIIVHQTLELWFKLILRELRLARNELSNAFVAESKVPYVVHHLSRIIEIFKVAKDHFTIMETLTPQDFLAFRGKLGTASGFQSYQLRELEILMGLEERDMVTLGDRTAHSHLEMAAKETSAGAYAWTRIQKAKEEVTIKHALEQWLYRTPIQGSHPHNPDDKKVVKQFVLDYMKAYRRLQESQAETLISNNLGTREDVLARVEAAVKAAENFAFAVEIPDGPVRDKTLRVRAAILFIESYRELPLLAWPRLLLDKVVEMEECFVIWRHRHARMVEREIGRRMGTGGSSGVDYLDSTTRYRVFGSLWTARTVILPKFALPPLRNAGLYDFEHARL